MLSGPAATGGVRRRWPPYFFCIAKRKERSKEKKRKSFKGQTIKRSKCYCFSHPRASRNKKNLIGQLWCPAILFSVPWLLHFKIHYAGPSCGRKLVLKTFVTILFFTFLGKTGVLLYWFATQYQYQQTCAFQRKSKTHFTSNLVQSWINLHPTSKNNCK